MTALPGSRSNRQGGLRALLALLLALLLPLLAPLAAWGGPVDWQEVPPTAAGRQWWDGGSLRVNRQGHLTVLSRFQPAAETSPADTPPRPGRLYVMELDCGNELYRDTAVNGIPRFRPRWQTSEGDALTSATIQASCKAGADLLAVAPHG